MKGSSSSKGKTLTEWIIMAFFLASALVFSIVSFWALTRQSDDLYGSLSKFNAERVANEIELLQNFDYATSKLEFGAKYAFHILPKKGEYAIRVVYKDKEKWSGESKPFTSVRFGDYGKYNIPVFTETENLCIVKLGDEFYLVDAEKKVNFGSIKLEDCRLKWSIL